MPCCTPKEVDDVESESFQVGDLTRTPNQPRDDVPAIVEIRVEVEPDFAESGAES